MTLDAFLGHFTAVRRVGKRWTAQCPAHDDRSRNTLHIGLGDGGQKRLVICRAGCDLNSILGPVRLKAADLFDDLPAGMTVRRARDPWSIEAVLREALRRARDHQKVAMALYPHADASKQGHRYVMRLRLRITSLGPESDEAWTLASAAAEVEREAFRREAEQDEAAHELRRA